MDCDATGRLNKNELLKLDKNDKDDSKPVPITFVKIPKSTFIMGSNKLLTAHPVHIVNLAPFEISVNEITNYQYSLFLNSALADNQIEIKEHKMPGNEMDCLKHNCIKNRNIKSENYAQNAQKNIPNKNTLVYTVYAKHGIFAGKPLIFLSPEIKKEITEKQCDIKYQNKSFKVLKGKNNYPVTWVTWYGAMMFADASGADLPTEAEWEYAAATNSRFVYATDNGSMTSQKALFSMTSKQPIAFKWDAVKDLVLPPFDVGPEEGNEFIIKRPLKMILNYPLPLSVLGRYKMPPPDPIFLNNMIAPYFNNDAEIGHTVEVGMFPSNPFKINDMTGSVREWCKDDFFQRFYWLSPQDNPLCIKKESKTKIKALRGGSFRDSGVSLMIQQRDAMKGKISADDIGFRIVKKLSQ